MTKHSDVIRFERLTTVHHISLPSTAELSDTLGSSSSSSSEGNERDRVSVFSQIEEKRMQLEMDLGIDTLMEAYSFLQVITPWNVEAVAV